jgi:hypothetical protein
VDTLPIAFYRASKVARFAIKREVNFQCAAAIFKAIDLLAYKKYTNWYKRIVGTIPSLSNVYTKKSVWCSLVLITNLAVDLHRDVTDCKDGWVFVQVFGEFKNDEHDWVCWISTKMLTSMSWKGGQAVCPNLKLIFNMQLGDIITLQSSILEHYVIPWAEGNRISCVFWMHKGMFNWKTLKVIQFGRPVPRPRE